MKSTPGRPAIELDRNGEVVDDLEARRRRWRRRCGLSKVLLISNSSLRFDRVGFHVAAGVESCEKLVTRQLRRQLQSVPRRAREDIKPLLELARPATIPAKAISPLAVAWLFSEANWRGLSTLRQVTTPPAHIQTLTWRWWTSVSEELRMGSADRLLESLKERVGNLYRFWECVARRMVIYEFYFLDPRLISIVFESPRLRADPKSYLAVAQCPVARKLLARATRICVDASRHRPVGHRAPGAVHPVNTARKAGNQGVSALCVR
jgi:hypothetical protein